MGRPKKKVSEEIIKQYNLELKLARNHTNGFLSDKKGKSTSCLMCQKRKTKCIKTTNENTCLNCLRSVIRCIPPNLTSEEGNSVAQDVSEDSKDQYIKFLEGKLSYLEDSLTELDNPSKAEQKKKKNADTSFQISTNQKFQKKIQKYKKISSFLNVSDKDYEHIVNKLYADIENHENRENSPSRAGHVHQHQNSGLRSAANVITSDIGAANVRTSDIGAANVITSDIGARNTGITNIGTTNIGARNTETRNTETRNADTFSARTLPPLYKSANSLSISETSKEPLSDSASAQSLNLQILGSIDFSRCILSKYNLTDFLSYDPAFSFDEVLSCQFLEIYFTRLQFKYPLLDKKEVFAFHHYYTQLNGKTPSKAFQTDSRDFFIGNFFQKYNMTNLMNTWKNRGNEIDYHYCCSRSWLIFAISSCLHKTSGKYRGLPPNRYFSTAIRHLAKCQDKLSAWEKVEILALSLQYIIRTDRDSLELYVILRDIVDISLNTLKLHDLSDCGSNSELRRKKVRLFWSVYLLDRMICNAVEKPFLITASIVPKDYPLFDLQTFEAGILIDERVDTRTPNEKVHFINQVIKLRILESDFTTTLDLMNWQHDRNSSIGSIFNGNNGNNASNKSAAKAIELRKMDLPKMERHYKALCDWRSSCKLKQFRAFETETLKLYYYRAVRLLIQPYLDLLKPYNKLFRECQAAAGQICQLYKIFHQKTVFGHSTSAVHTVFSAGLTLIYCLWLARNHDDYRRRKLGDSAKHTRPTLTGTLIASFDDLRACSVSLYVMAERSRFAVIYRDTFDQLMQCTIGNLIERSGPNSSELIPTKTHLSNQSLSVKQDSKNAGEFDGVLAEEDDEEEEDNKNMLSFSVTSPDNDAVKSGIPAAINRKFGVRQEIEHSRFLQNIHVDTEEQRELKRRRGVLKKTMLPKPLSNLLDAYDTEKKLNDSKKKAEKKTFYSSPEDLVAATNTNTITTTTTSKENIEYKESDYLKQQQNDERLVSATTEPREDSYSSSLGSPRYFVQKPLQNPTEEEWKNLELKALIKQQAGQQSLQASLTGVPTTIHTDIIENADAWDFTLNANGSNNALFEFNKPQKFANLDHSPSYNFLQEYSGTNANIENMSIQSFWTPAPSEQRTVTNDSRNRRRSLFKQPDCYSSMQPKNHPDNAAEFEGANALPGQNGAHFSLNDRSALDVGIPGAANAKNSTNNGSTTHDHMNSGSTSHDHMSNPINQSAVQHMISNISQWTSAGFEDFFFGDFQQSQQNDAARQEQGE